MYLQHQATTADSEERTGLLFFNINVSRDRVLWPLLERRRVSLSKELYQPVSRVVTIRFFGKSGPLSEKGTF